MKHIVFIVALFVLACTSFVFAEETGDTIQWLFVQNSEGVELEDGILTLKDVGKTTLYFSDRPERLAGHIPTVEFLDFWNDGGDDSFATDPPNATLSIFHGDEVVDVVVELSNPRLDDDDFIYDIKIIDGEELLEKEFLEKSQASSLFIDVIGRPLTPVSVAGVARRTTRRTVRRHSVIH